MAILVSDCGSISEIHRSNTGKYLDVQIMKAVKINELVASGLSAPTGD
jgi:hypothetical protein